MKIFYNPILKELARQLRNNSTKAEIKSNSKNKIKSNSKSSIISNSDIIFEKQFQIKGENIKKPYPTFLEMDLENNSKKQNYKFI